MEALLIEGATRDPLKNNMVPKTKHHKLSKAWLVSVDMGYGHERAAYGLKDLAYGPTIVANNYRGIPDKDRRYWRECQAFYEKVSKFKTLPIIGNFVFDAYDNLQSIPPFYPRRDMSHPNVQLKEL